MHCTTLCVDGEKPCKASVFSVHAMSEFYPDSHLPQNITSECCYKHDCWKHMFLASSAFHSPEGFQSIPFPLIEFLAEYFFLLSHWDSSFPFYCCFKYCGLVCLVLVQVKREQFYLLIFSFPSLYFPFASTQAAKSVSVKLGGCMDQKTMFWRQRILS